MKRRPKPTKRQRLKVERPVLHRARTRPGRVFRVQPDPDRPFIVEVRLARNGRWMRDAVNFHEGANAALSLQRDCAGCVWHYFSKATGRYQYAHGRIVARMFLNLRDLKFRPTEIVSHECGHAAMAWARLQRANLREMPGEEVMCYALGRMAREIVNRLHAWGVFQ